MWGGVGWKCGVCVCVCVCVCGFWVWVFGVRGPIQGGIEKRRLQDTDRATERIHSDRISGSAGKRGAEKMYAKVGTSQMPSQSENGQDRSKRALFGGQLGSI